MTTSFLNNKIEGLFKLQLGFRRERRGRNLLCHFGVFWGGPAVIWWM